jgi:hypothetical protein
MVSRGFLSDSRSQNNFYGRQVDRVFSWEFFTLSSLTTTRDRFWRELSDGAKCSSRSHKNFSVVRSTWRFPFFNICLSLKTFHNRKSFFLSTEKFLKQTLINHEIWQKEVVEFLVSPFKHLESSNWLKCIRKGFRIFLFASRKATKSDRQFNNLIMRSI